MNLIATIIRRRLAALALAWLLAVITLMAGMALLGVSGWFLTATALAGAVSFNLFIPSSLVRGFAFIRIVSRYGERVTGHAATLSILSDLRVLVFSRLIPIVPIRGAAMRTGDYVARLTADIEALDMVFLQALLPIGAALVAGTGLAILLGIFLPEAAWIGVGGFAATTLAVPLLLSRLGRAPGTAVVARSADLRVLALDGVDGQADIVALGIQPAVAGDFVRRANGLRAARLNQARWMAFGPATMQLGAGATSLGVLWIGLGAFAEGRIGGPMLVGVLLAVLASFEASGAVLRGAGRLGGALAASKRIRALLTAEPAVDEPKKPAKLATGGGLVVGRVGFAQAERSVLHDLSLSVASGDRIAIIGESGSGKSTLLSLLIRLADPSQGSIRIGGVDIRDVAIADLHSHVALLTQETPVFIGTIRDNLRIGAPDADDATFFAALARARLDTFVRHLPQGLDTWLGEAGETLSAGQARRLCLARTLLSPAEILLLDEPTAGLDPETEAELLGDIVGAADGRMLILATHAALPEGAVDRVYRLEDGRLAAI